MHEASFDLMFWLYIYSVTGAVLIVCGLYAVLWSKSKEMKKKAQLEITNELEEVEFVMSNPNPNKCVQNNRTQTTTIGNVTNNHK